MNQMQSKILILFDYLYIYINFCRKFDGFAASIIDQCFDVNKDYAVALLRRPAPAFFHAEPLELSLRADCRAFLASRCVQRHLDNEWLYLKLIIYFIKLNFYRFGNINYKRQNINIRVD